MWYRRSREFIRDQTVVRSVSAASIWLRNFYRLSFSKSFQIAEQKRLDFSLGRL